MRVGNHARNYNMVGWSRGLASQIAEGAILLESISENITKQTLIMLKVKKIRRFLSDYIFGETPPLMYEECIKKQRRSKQKSSRPFLRKLSINFNCLLECKVGYVGLKSSIHLLNLSQSFIVDDIRFKALLSGLTASSLESLAPDGIDVGDYLLVGESLSQITHKLE